MIVVLRSPNTNNANNYWNVTAAGANNNNNANNAYGVCFGFGERRISTSGVQVRQSNTYSVKSVPSSKENVSVSQEEICIVIPAVGRCLHGMGTALAHISWLFRSATSSPNRCTRYAERQGRMTSAERHEFRYQRRRAARLAKRNAVVEYCDDFENVFRYKNMYRAYKKCIRGVRWKASTQKYIASAPLLVYRSMRKVLTGKFVSRGFIEFDLYERGKARHIRSILIDERVIQRCLCDNALVPVLRRSFIYDNGACLSGKGYHFAQRRLFRHLEYHYHKHGTEGYILTFDFKSYFDSIPHDHIRRIIEKAFHDQRLKDLVCQLVDDFGDVGLGLGSQISQVLAVAAPSCIDHYIKDVLRVKCYGRYNDDGYVIHTSKDFLQDVKRKLAELAEQIGLKINLKKTKITKLTKPFMFLKIRCFISDTGKVVKRVWKKSATRMSRKLRKFKQKVLDGIMSWQDVHNSFHSWLSHLKGLHCYQTIKSITKKYKKLRREICVLSN